MLSVVLGYIKAKVALQIITNSNVLYSKVLLNKWPNTAGFVTSHVRNETVTYVQRSTTELTFFQKL